MLTQKNFILALTLTVGSLFSSNSLAQQEETVSNSSAKPGRIKPFAEVVKESFSQWDVNGDGKLSPDEIVAALSNQKFRDESAAAIVAIEKVVREGKYNLPPLTEEFLISSPLKEPSEAGQEGDSKDDESKSEHFNHPPAFQPRYFEALRRINNTSRELFLGSLPSFEATHQGSLGDCPFVSTVGAMVYRDPSAVKAMFNQNENGSTTVTLGNGHNIKIAHLTDSDIAMWSSAGTNGLWLTILEKAYRRVHLETDRPERTEKANIYGKFGSSRTIEILDGHETRKVPLGEIEPGSQKLAALRKDLSAAQREHLLVKAGTPVRRTTPGITPEHAYAVLGYDEGSDTVLVWNPHGNNFTPKGLDGLQNGYTTRGGQFKIPLKDMLKIFTNIVFETRART